MKKLTAIIAAMLAAGAVALCTTGCFSSPANELEQLAQEFEKEAQQYANDLNQLANEFEQELNQNTVIYDRQPVYTEEEEESSTPSSAESSGNFSALFNTDKTTENIVSAEPEQDSTVTEEIPEFDETESEAAFILPDSDARYVSKSELKILTDRELLLARNEIYARHGRKFNDRSIQAYFDQQDWYRGTVDPDDFSDKVFNQYEVANITTIIAAENSRK